MKNYNLATKIVTMASKLAIYSEFNNKDEDYQAKRTDMYSDFCKFVYGEVLDNLKNTLDK